ncbi:MAG: dephospho-CoA kinase [Aquificae bacterium]|nr:dephospho-CoA kinase [Aquificota bacterium]
MLKIGLTGSIGTGKSTVKNLLNELGAYTIDADNIVHHLLTEPPIITKIEKEFGKEVISNKKIDKKKLAQIIFSDPNKKKKLENILHPEVFKTLNHFFEEIQKKDPCAVAVAEVPLMIETGSYKNYDLIILVYAPKELQLKRLIQKGMSKDEALARINSQMDIEKKKRYADILIENTDTLEELKKKVADTYKILKEKTKKDCI